MQRISEKETRRVHLKEAHAPIYLQITCKRITVPPATCLKMQKGHRQGPSRASPR